MAVTGEIRVARLSFPTLVDWGILFARRSSTILTPTLSILRHFHQRYIGPTRLRYVAIRNFRWHIPSDKLCGADRSPRHPAGPDYRLPGIHCVAPDSLPLNQSFAAFRFLLEEPVEIRQLAGASKAVSGWFPKCDRGLAAAWYDSAHHPAARSAFF